MTIYTCGVGGEQAETRTILQPSGERVAIVCPVHGVLATQGFKPAAGTAGAKVVDAAPLDTLTPGQWTKLAANRWAARPPAGEAFLVGIASSEDANGLLTIKGFVDTARWRGWLEAGVWLEEQN
jgi:hypothetical protein